MMPLIPIGQNFVLITVLVLAVAVGLLAIVVIWTFERRKALLPDATNYEDLKERNGALEVRIQGKNDELRQLEQKIHDRDRIGADIAVLTERLETLRAELAALPNAEQQIDAMKQRAADAAAAFAVASEKLGEVKLALQEGAGRLTAAQARLDGLTKDADELDAGNKLLRETLPDEIEELRHRLGELATEKTALEREVSQIKSVREALFAAREETAALAARNDALAARYQELQSTLPGQIEALTEGVGLLRAKRDELSQEVSQNKGVLESLVAARDEVDALAARIEGLNLAVDAARKTREDLFVELETKRQEQGKLTDEIGTLKAQRASLEQITISREELIAAVDELRARKLALEEVVARLRGEASGGTQGDPDQAGVTADLQSLPSCLVSVLSTAYGPQDEHQALHGVAEHLTRHGLTYDQRTLYAFHTALKINETSQMTVLAGVSGTGKSLLPRRYAEAMGLHFLQIAVEPRWDSPQDLLGFYNYIEKRYRATDLARALVHMDPFNTSKLSGQPHEDEVLLVLLDEMNLARVEYYFSEFLSRLELRPSRKELGTAGPPQNACLPIDIPGRKDGPIRLFPSYNVLFAGTMNDDETTQSLSDKVLDRSNVMQFPAPEQFDPPKVPETTAASGKYRSFQQWTGWLKPTSALAGADREKADRIIRRLAKIMDDCGRPFGYRLNDAILAYVANYPQDEGALVDLPLADQVELRILPKLRGLVIDDRDGPLKELEKLIGEDLHDTRLAARFKDSVDRPRNGQFNLRGFRR